MQGVLHTHPSMGCPLTKAFPACSWRLDAAEAAIPSSEGTPSSEGSEENTKNPPNPAHCQSLQLCIYATSTK